jgi:hypothetical protein
MMKLNYLNTAPSTQHNTTSQIPVMLSRRIGDVYTRTRIMAIHTQIVGKFLYPWQPACTSAMPHTLNQLFTGSMVYISATIYKRKKRF